MPDTYPKIMGDCGCLNCGAGDPVIGEQTFQDITYYPNDTTISPTPGVLNGGAPVPRGAYFLKYCGGYYRAQIPGVGVAYCATQGLRLATVNPLDAVNKTVYSFPAPWPGIATMLGIGYDTSDKLAAAEGCLGLGFYVADNTTAPNTSLVNFPVNLMEAPATPPRYRVYRYFPLFTLAYFFLDYGLNAWLRGSTLYSWRAYIGLINPAKAPWQLNASFRASGGVSQSSIETLNAPAKSITEISVYYNVNPTTKYDSQLALTLTDGVNTNADIAINLTPKLFVISSSVGNGGVIGGVAVKSAIIIIGNMGFGQINTFTANLSGPNMAAPPAQPGSLTLTGSLLINGFGSNRLQHETNSNFSTSQIQFKYVANPSNPARTALLHITSPGQDWGTFDIPIPAG